MNEQFDFIKNTILSSLHKKETFLIKDNPTGKQYLLAGTPMIEDDITSDFIDLIKKYEKKYGFPTTSETEHYEFTNDMVVKFMDYICSTHNAELVYASTEF